MTYNIVSGFKFPVGYKEDNINFALNYCPKDGQKFIVAYPKSGTTWAQQIAYLILNNGIPEKNNKQFIFDTFLEFSGKDVVTEPMIKTHLPYNLMPFKENAKYLFVFRNPKDVFVSIYYHLKTRFGYEKDFHQCFNDIINGNVFYGDYFDFNQSFVPHLNDSNVTFLVYEQMKLNPRDAVLRIAGFLGEEYISKVKDNNEFVLNKVLKYSTVDYMKSDSKNNEFIIRKGIVGDWRTHYTECESRLVDQKFQQYFKGTQLQDLWSEVMKI